MINLNNVPNIGRILEKTLKNVGIENYEELKRIGSKATFLKIKKIDPTACFNMLCALEGAIQNVRWHDLDDVIKNELKVFFHSL